MDTKHISENIKLFIPKYTSFAIKNIIRNKDIKGSIVNYYLQEDM